MPRDRGQRAERSISSDNGRFLLFMRLREVGIMGERAISIANRIEKDGIPFEEAIKENY